MKKEKDDERHYIITRIRGNHDCVLNDYPPALKENALRKFEWLGRHNRVGLICLYRGFREADGSFNYKKAENIVNYVPDLVRQGYPLRYD